MSLLNRLDVEKLNVMPVEKENSIKPRLCKNSTKSKFYAKGAKKGKVSYTSKKYVAKKGTYMAFSENAKEDTLP